MTNIKNQIFSSYMRNPSLFDEIYDKNGEVREIYQKLFQLYGELILRNMRF